MTTELQMPVANLKKSMYRAVDLIENFFPSPNKSVGGLVVLDKAQKDFIDCIQYGFPLSQFRFGEVRPVRGVITIWRRQVGKSWSTGLAAAALMILYPGCTIGVVAASEEQSQILIDKIKLIFDQSQFADFVEGRPKLTLLKLKNGSVCRSHPASERSIRGYTYDWVIIDESALMDEQILLSAVLPTVTHGKRWIAISTPRGRKGKLIEYYYKSLESRPIICKGCGKEYVQRQFPEYEFPVNKMPVLPKCVNKLCGSRKYKYGMGIYATPYLDPWDCSMIDPVDLKAELDLHEWSPWARQELLGEILDEASMVILKEWIDKQINYSLRNVMKVDPEQTYILGVDYGRQHDATSFCVSHYDRTTKQVIIDYMRTVSGENDHDTDYAQIREHMEEIVRFYRPRWIIPDATGLGQPLVEQLQSDLRRWGVSSSTSIYREKNKQLGFVFSRTTKADLIGNLIRMLSENPHRLQIPPPTEPEIHELQTELLRFECEVQDGGYIKYGTQDYHDDRVIALALSLWMHRRGSYSSFNAKFFDYGESKTTRESVKQDWNYTQLEMMEIDGGL
jgi:hypothetical protein